MSTELDQEALAQLRFRALDEIARAHAEMAASEAKRTYWSKLLASLRPGEWVALASIGDFKAADAATVRDAAAQLISALSDEIAALRVSAAEDRQRFAVLEAELTKSRPPRAL